MIGTQTVESLFDKELIPDKFYPESRALHKERESRALHNNQLSSFSSKFYTFATTEDDIGPPQGCEKMAETLFKKCGQWCKSLRKEVKERFWEKEEEDLAGLITPEKVQEFACNQVKIIGDLIGKGQNSTSLSPIEYCDLRNFLFIHLLSQNGHRSGVITNSTLDEYKEISCVDETYMISVKDHKTYSQHGPANLCFDESLKGWLDIYVEHTRQQVVNGIGSPCLFLNWKAAKMQSSDLASGITSAWWKGGMVDKTRISGTL